jgi:hypothetical protein
MNRSPAYHLAMPTRSGLPPTVTWLYGLLGLIPFFGAAGAALLTFGPARAVAQMALLGYGGLILSFLGGGRWGLEIGRRPVRPLVISASMLPTIVAFLLLVAPVLPIRLRLLGMAAALVAQWAWDVRSADTPNWYPTLRHVLTAGAVACLATAAAASPTL